MSYYADEIIYDPYATPGLTQQQREEIMTQNTAAKLRRAEREENERIDKKSPIMDALVALIVAIGNLKKRVR